MMILSGQLSVRFSFLQPDMGNEELEADVQRGDNWTCLESM